MNRNRRVTITILTLAALALATAAYAPHSETLTRLANNNASITPCGATPAFQSPSPDVASAQAPKYPAPSEDEIARGHSGL
jgi:hypothetical protein